jgi:hypothetical protein
MASWRLKTAQALPMTFYGIQVHSLISCALVGKSLWTKTPPSPLKANGKHKLCHHAIPFEGCPFSHSRDNYGPISCLTRQQSIGFIFDRLAQNLDQISFVNSQL